MKNFGKLLAILLALCILTAKCAQKKAETNAPDGIEGLLAKGYTHGKIMYAEAQHR